jgi:predicted Zn-dependent protease
MGQLYFRQENYDLALVHFKAAAVVNPQSSVLRCYWGMALAKQGILNNALAKLEVGCRGENCCLYRT